MRDYLRKVTEQYEAATEELRAANEESRSANEEMQSTNEELRTAKEEIQSSNEELTTVNDELKHRNKELRLSNNDLTNVLGAATIPILMVGMDLCLRRFTLCIAFKGIAMLLTNALRPPENLRDAPRRHADEGRKSDSIRSSQRAEKATLGPVWPFSASSAGCPVNQKIRAFEVGFVWLLR